MTRLAPEDCSLPEKTSALLDNFGTMVAIRSRKTMFFSLDKEARENTPENQAKIDHWLEIINRHPESKALLDEALASDTKIYADTTIKPLGFYSPSENILVVNPNRTEGGINDVDGAVIATMLHELTHSHQDKLGYGLSPIFSPRDLLLLLFNMEANAEANAVDKAFKLAKAGFPGAIEAHLRSGYGDISRAYLDKIKENPENANNGMAARAAHDQWFEASWRRKIYGQQATGIAIKNIKVFAQVFVTQGFKPMTPDFLAGMTENPDGSNYLDATLETGDNLTGERYRKGLTAEIEEALCAIDTVLQNIKAQVEGKLPAPPSRRQGNLGPDDKDPYAIIRKAGRKFTSGMVFPDKPVNGIYIGIPVSPDKHRKLRKKTFPMPVFTVL